MVYKNNLIKKLSYETQDNADFWLREYKSRILSDGTPLTESTAAFVRGEITMLIGREGAGKTTLVRTLSSGFCKKENRCGFVLTEETIQDYKIGMGYSYFLSKQKIPVYPIYEQAYMTGLSKKDSDDVWNSMPIIVDEFIKEYKLDVLFIDNMTTNKSVLEYNLSEQTELFLQLKAISHVRKCSIVLIYHTGKQVRDNIFENADIEGSNAPAKLSPNILLHYNFKEMGKAIVKINKIRFDAGLKGDPFHVINFNKGVYEYSHSLSYESFNNMIKTKKNSKK